MAGDKYYNAERARQAQFKKLEEERNKKYKEKTEKETAFEYLNALHPEDSTREYNPVEHYKGGGIARGCGKVMGDRRKVTKMY
jgi:acetyl-CoA carboxylase carboxyltransferase component